MIGLILEHGKYKEKYTTEQPAVIDKVWNVAKFFKKLSIFSNKIVAVYRKNKCFQNTKSGGQIMLKIGQ